MTRRRYVLPIMVYAALMGSLRAATLTLTDTWQNLGTGPLAISVLNGDGLFEASATAPTDNGQPIYHDQQPFPFNATLSIWGKRRAPAVRNGAALPTLVVSSPIVAGSSGNATYNGIAADQTAANTNDGVATSSTNQHDVSYPYLFNGTTYDRWYGSVAGGARVNVTNFPSVQPISGTVGISGTPTFNLSQFAGTAVATGGGTSNAGTLRVILATDSPGGTSSGGTGGAANPYPGSDYAKDHTDYFKAGGSIANTAFGISGTLPAYASIPAFKIDQTTPGTTNKVSTDIGTYLNPNAPAGGAAITASSPVALPKDQGLLVGAGESSPSTLTAGQLATLSLSLGHLLRVDGSGVTQPVSGSVAATLAGSLPAYASTPTFNIGTGLPASYPDAVADAVLGTQTDSAFAGGTGSATIAAILRGTYNLIQTQGQSPIVAGSAIIGKVGIDQTTPGTTNKVSLGTDTITTSPSNASTVATLAAQQAVQSAPGTVQSTALTIQGNASGIPVKSDISAYVNPNAPAGGAATTASSPVALPKDQGLLVGAGESSASSLTAGQLATLSFTLTHAARVDTLGAGGASAINQTNPQGPVSGGNAAANSVLGGCIYNSTALALTTGQQAGLQCDASGRPYSDISPYLNPNAPAGGAATTASSPVALPKDQGLLTGTGEASPSALTAGQLATLSFTLGHLVRVDGSGVTQPVSGTVTANIGTAPTLVVQGLAGGTAIPVSGTFFQATQPISAASLPLPTGASSAVNQTLAVGPVAPGTVATNSMLVGGKYTAAGVTLTDGQQAGAQFDSAGRLITNIAASLNPNAPAGGALTSASSPVALPKDQVFTGGGMPVGEIGTSLPAGGIVPAITQSGTSVVGKTTQGNLYSAYAVLGAAASAQTYLVTINATAAPTSGTAITPVDVAIFPSNAIGATAQTGFPGAPPNAYSAGVVSLVTTSLTTYTPGAASFMQDRVR